MHFLIQPHLEQWIFAYSKLLEHQVQASRLSGHVTVTIIISVRTGNDWLLTNHCRILG